MPYGVGLVADAIVKAATDGLCGFRRVCELCDCFAHLDGGRYRDDAARVAAERAIARFLDTR